MSSKNDMQKYQHMLESYSYGNPKCTHIHCKICPDHMGQVNKQAIFSSAFTYYEVTPNFYQKIQFFLAICATITAIIFKFMKPIHMSIFFFSMFISFPYFIPSYKLPSIDVAKCAPSNMRPVTKELESVETLQYFKESLKYLKTFKDISFFSLAREERVFSCQIMNSEWKFYDMKKKSILEMDSLMSEWIDRMCMTSVYLEKLGNAAAFENRSFLIDVIVFMLDCFEKMDKMPQLSVIIAKPRIHKFKDGYGIVWNPCEEGSHKCRIMNGNVVEWVKKYTLSKFMDLFKKEKNETKQIIVDYIRKYGFCIIGDFLANDYDDEVLALILLDILDQYNKEGEFDSTIEQIKKIVSI